MNTLEPQNLQEQEIQQNKVKLSGSELQEAEQVDQDLKQSEVQQNQVEIQDQQNEQNEENEKNNERNDLNINKYGGKNYSNNFKGKKFKGGYGYQNQYNKHHINNMINTYFNQMMAYFGTKAYLSKDKVYKYQNEFPRAISYQNYEQIAEAFPHLKNVNQIDIDASKIKNAKFFILRSNNDDDIHKAIKYGIWTSTPNNNAFLNQAYEEAKKNNQDIYLLFSVVKSGQFLGIGKLNSGQAKEDFKFWFQRYKFLGQFKIDFFYLKDIPYKQFETILDIDQKPIIKSKDCTEIKFETAGQEIIKIFKEQANEPNIFGEFEFMDKREDLLRSYFIYLDNLEQQYFQQQQYQNEMSYYYNNQYYQNGGNYNNGIQQQQQYGYQQYHQQNKSNYYGGGAQNGYQNKLYQQYQQQMNQNQQYAQQQQQETESSDNIVSQETQQINQQQFEVQAQQ